ncbi:hypothetical protein BH23BAC1_BH23BAC1_19500 [soil metagenome]
MRAIPYFLVLLLIVYVEGLEKKKANVLMTVKNHFTYKIKFLFGGEDLVWRIIGSLLIPFLVDMLGREESIWQWITHKYFWFNLGYGFVAAFLLISFIRILTRYLKIKYSGDEQKTQRMLFQITFGVVATAVGVHLFMYLQDAYLLPDSIFSSTWLLYEFPFIVLMIVLLNVIYLYYFSSVSLTSRQENKVKPAAKSVLVATKGYKHYPIPVDQIACIYRKENTNWLITFQEDHYLIEPSLEEVYDQLNPTLFFRANRQSIINFMACDSFSVIENNKIELNLRVKSVSKIIISQKTSPGFKVWMNR